MAVFGVVDILGTCSEDVHILGGKTRSKVVWNLTTGRENCAVRLLDIDDIHHTFKCKFVEIETVAHIIIGRYCLGVVVYHHRAPTLFFHCLKRIHTTPVKFHRTTDAICARTEHYHALSIAFILNIILAAIVGEIEIVGHGGELACKGVDLLHHRGDSMRLAKRAHFKIRFFGISHSVFEHCTRNLEVAEALFLGMP